MNNKKIISWLYDNSINFVLLGIDKKYKEELKDSYLEYLNRIYSNYKLPNKNSDDILNGLLKLEELKWKNSVQSVKLSSLLTDSAFENIQYILNVSEEYANKRIDPNNVEGNLTPVIGEEQAKRNIEMLNFHLKSVREFNKEFARQLVSRAIINYKYACGLSDMNNNKIIQ